MAFVNDYFKKIIIFEDQRLFKKLFMKFTPRAVSLKNGKKILLRSAQISDAAPLIQTVKEYLSDSDYIPQSPEEFNLTIEQEEHWIASFLERENSLLILAEFDGKLIGNIDISGHTRQMMEHTAVIGMGIISEWRNTGLGTQLMQHAIDWARENALLELLWLQVYTDNQMGLALYKKMGFQEIGVIPNFFKHDHRYYDNLTMSLTVN